MAATSPPPTVGMAADRATGGYWLVAADGTVTAFDAPALGPASGHLPVGPVVGVASTADGTGVWEVTRAGDVYAFGDAVFRGPGRPLEPAAPIEGIDRRRPVRRLLAGGADGACSPSGPASTAPAERRAPPAAVAAERPGHGRPPGRR